MLVITSYGVKSAGHGQTQINRKHPIRSAMGVSNLVYTNQYTASSCREHHNHMHHTTHLTITTPITTISCEPMQLMLERPPSPTPLRRKCHAGTHLYNQIRAANHFEAGAEDRRTNSFPIRLHPTVAHTHTYIHPHCMNVCRTNMSNDSSVYMRSPSRFHHHMHPIAPSIALWVVDGCIEPLIASTHDNNGKFKNIH